MMQFQPNRLADVVSGVKLARYGLKIYTRVKTSQKNLPILQTPQTLKLSWSTHPEKFMACRPRFRLYDLRVLLSPNRHGKNETPWKFANLTA